LLPHSLEPCSNFPSINGLIRTWSFLILSQQAIIFDKRGLYQFVWTFYPICIFALASIELYFSQARVVTELETVYATAEQQQEMDRLLKENNKKE
jgi:hypothetical protein